MLQEIPLVWTPLRNYRYAGMLGQQQLAYILCHDGEACWRWIVVACSSTEHCEFQSADSLDDAKAAVLASIWEWFRLAGLFQ